jgi:hypothetical protein
VNITEFLEARISEDVAAAREVETDFQFDPSSPLYSPLDVYSPGGYDTAPVISIDSTRVLAECAAKRAIIEVWEDPNGAGVWEGYDAGYAISTDRAARTLAAIYKDHPDYQQGWLSK